MTRRILLLLVLVLMLNTPGHALAIPRFSDIFVFGDSISDGGNAFILSGLLDPPPVPGSPYFAGRFTNGPNYADVLAANLDLGPLLPSLAGGNNFAIGGARAASHPDLTPEFGVFGQVNTFLDAVELSTGQRQVDPDALYVVWGGSNDIRDALSESDTDILTAAARSLFDAVSELTEANAEHLIVPTAPDIGLVPEVLELAPFVPGLPDTATLFSSLLNEALDDLLLGLSDVDIIRFDAFTLLQEAAASTFGFMNVDSACYTGPLEGVPSEMVPAVTCPQPDTFLFWDDLHPSARAHRIVGNQMTSAVPAPITLALIGIGFAALGFRRECRRALGAP